MPIALFAGLGGQEIIIIAVVALILFGATKVPQFMKGLGQGVKEFKDAIKDDDDPGKARHRLLQRFHQHRRQQPRRLPLPRRRRNPDWFHWRRQSRGCISSGLASTALSQTHTCQGVARQVLPDIAYQVFR